MHQTIEREVCKIGGRGSNFSSKLSVSEYRVVSANSISQSSLTKIQQELEDQVSKYNLFLTHDLLSRDSKGEYNSNSSSFGIVSNTFSTPDEMMKSFRDMNIDIIFDGVTNGGISYSNISKDKFTHANFVELGKAVVEMKNLFENEWGIPYGLSKIHLYSDPQSGVNSSVTRLRVPTVSSDEGLITEPILHVNLSGMIGRSEYYNQPKPNEFEKSYNKGEGVVQNYKDLVYHESIHLLQAYLETSGRDKDYSFIETLEDRAGNILSEKVSAPSEYGRKNNSEMVAEGGTLLLKGLTTNTQYTQDEWGFKSYKVIPTSLVTEGEYAGMRSWGKQVDIQIDGGSKFVEELKPYLDSSGFKIPDKGVSFIKIKDTSFR